MRCNEGRLVQIHKSESIRAFILFPSVLIVSILSFHGIEFCTFTKSLKCPGRPRLALSGKSLRSSGPPVQCIICEVAERHDFAPTCLCTESVPHHYHTFHTHIEHIWFT